ncbi:FliA/WhiG family RNA polymerase sigma factor [Pseudonocardia kujensis]|uniref:FliA/WhiG family RNA polymerase sigma factor n=1 Tax=Pseudonocardia kujensis TaxID=1128675 RepID=UPI001E646093|nr:FliA/WhiG family RNA polymerase sigma factor [Pseudonocardia kujensis]MCE0768189.1 FliA/WhiG family RNA polymerase sigma factor [Pseudonocardia kujensis]
MTRLIPGHDAPDAESAQVTRQVGGPAGALAGVLTTADAPAVAERRVSLRAVPAESGVSPDVASGAEPNLGGPHRAAEHVALVAPLRPDTPGSSSVPSIGHPGSTNGTSGREMPFVDGGAAPTAAPMPTRLAPTGGAEEAAEPPAPEAARIASDITSTLWADYLASRAPAARDRLVIHYRALVRGVAGRMAGGLPTHVDAADLVQVGMFGLIDAVERFEPEREVRFESFAAQRIRGAMLDELRAQDWVPRTARARRREAERARERLETRLGRTVDDREVAEELGVGLRDLRGMLQHRQLVSVEALESGGEGQAPVAELVADESAPDPLEVVEQGETVRELALAVGALGERDREVVRLYYLENRTLAEIGRLLGVTESRVCQLHSRLVTRLRTRLTEPA